jgi:hypothetical protein
MAMICRDDIFYGHVKSQRDQQGESLNLQTLKKQRAIT